MNGREEAGAMFLSPLMKLVIFNEMKSMVTVVDYVGRYLGR